MIDPSALDLIAQAHAALWVERALRLVVLLVSLPVLVHFSCMACVCHGPTVPALDALLIGAAGASALGTAYAAAWCPLLEVLGLHTLMSACLIAHALRLWQRGFHVSAFLRSNTPCS